MGHQDEELLRQEAAGWFARLRAPQAESDRAAFDAWRTADPARQRAYDRMVQRWEASAVLAGSRLPGLRLARTPARRAATTPILAGAIAAGLVAAVGAGAWWQAHAQTERYVTAVGEIRTFALADGRALTLDTDSLATRQRRGGQDIVRLQRGRARLSTTAPTLIDADGTSILAQGGQVDLTRGADRSLDVSAITAQVESRGPDRAFRLRAGEHLVLASSQAGAPAPAPQRTRDWPSGLAVYDGAPLSQVLVEANRYGGPSLRLEDPALGALKVTGGFKITRTEPLARALAAAFGLNVGKAPGGDLVLARRTL
jgi:transmembrane sensor